MKKIIFLIPMIILFLSACGDIEQVLSKNAADNNAAQNESSDNGGTNQGNGNSDNIDNSGSNDNTGGNEGEVTEPENPNGDGNSGEVVDPVEPGGDDNQGSEVVEPNPDGDGNTGGEVIEPNPDGDSNTGGEVVEPVEPGEDGNGSEVVDPVNPGGDSESGTTTPDKEEIPAYNKDFNALTDVFEPNLYYGRSLLNEEEKKAYDVIMDTLVKFNITENNANDSRIGVQLTANNVKVSLEQLKKVATTIGYDEQRLTYITSFVPKWKATGSPLGTYPTYENGYVKEVFFDVRNVKPAQPYAILQDTKLEHEAEMKSVEEGVVKILSKLKYGMTEAQKFRLLHDEFLKTVSYGQILTGSGDIRGGFINYKVLCEGYARSLSYLCQRAGLECIYVVGTASYDGTGSNGTSAFDHAWIKVKIDGKWYNVDPTNNDSINPTSDGIVYNDFLLSDSDFNDDHKAGVTTKGSKTSYDSFPESASDSYPFDDTAY